MICPSARRPLFWGCLVALILIATHATKAATLHVSATGTEPGNGAEATPFATINAAVDAAIKAGDVSEIVIHAGTYPGEILIPPASAENAAAAPAWTIRAATKADGTYDQVIIDGGQKVTAATLVDEKNGVYFFPIHLANYEPSMWEADKRVRYPFLADRRAVAAFPTGLAPGRYVINGDEKEGVFFRTSDSKSPENHDLGLARDRRGISVQRANVTIKGLHFQNFQLYFGVSAIMIEGANVTIDSCHAWNCWGGFMVSENVVDAKIINCTARDVATGAKSYGKNTVVENCRFIRINDDFEVQEYEQDQCGVQFYTSHTQTVRNTLCVGFQAGIFIKASGGVATLENNTVIAPSNARGERGIGPNTWRPSTICRGNVVVGYGEPLSHGELIKDCVIADNLFWLGSDPKQMDVEVARIQKDNGGQNVAAPPQFVNPAKEDYRLASTSAGATLASGGKAIGALGAAPKDVVAQAPADAKLALTQVAKTQAPKLAGQPVLYATERGAVVLFKTTVPCVAAVEWGSDKDHLDRRIDDADDYRNAPLQKDVPAETAAAVAPLRADHSLAILNNVAPGATYAYRIVLGGETQTTSTVHQGQFTLKGAARTLHVSTTGADDEAAGTSAKPFATLQFAVDRALPGDRVILAPGIYTGTTWITHGGVKDYPLTIESAVPWDAPDNSGGAVLDGRRLADHAIRIGHVANTLETWAMGNLATPAVTNVHIKGLEVRWYNGLCIRADEAQDISITNCKFWGRHYVKGRPGTTEGVGAIHCERLTVDHCLFFMLNAAVRFNTSAGFRLTSNTAAKCFHRAIGIVGARDIYIRNNSFAFGASYILTLHGVELKEVNSDYNNFAVHLRDDGVGFDVAPAEERLKREDNDFYYGESKSLAAWDERTAEKPSPYLATMTAWREATGQDKHSIFIHPRYVDPQNRDFRLLPNSPNIGKGENGVNIGALGVGNK